MKEVTVLTVSTKPLALVAEVRMLVVRTGGKASSWRILNPHAPGGRTRYSPDGMMMVVVEVVAFVSGGGGYGWPFAGTSLVVTVVTMVLVEKLKVILVLARLMFGLLVRLAMVMILAKVVMKNCW